MCIMLPVYGTNRCPKEISRFNHIFLQIACHSSSHFKQIFHPVLVSYSTGYHPTCVASAIFIQFKTSVVPGSRLTSELYHKSWDVPNPTLFIASFDLCVCVSVFLSIFFCVCSVFNTVKHGSVFSMAKTHFL